MEVIIVGCYVRESDANGSTRITKCVAQNVMKTECMVNVRHTGGNTINSVWKN